MKVNKKKQTNILYLVEIGYVQFSIKEWDKETVGDANHIREYAVGL